MKVTNIFATLLLIGFLSSPAFAESHPEKMGNFETHKSQILKNIDKHLAVLQEKQNCVKSAQDKDGLKDCMESFKKHKKEFKKMREKHREMRKEMMDKDRPRDDD